MVQKQEFTRHQVTACMSSLAVSATPSTVGATPGQTRAIGSPRTRALLGFLRPQGTAAYLTTIHLI